MAEQFKPQYFQSAPPPTYDEQGVARATAERSQQTMAAMQALAQLAQQNQQIQVARGELARKVAEDASMERYRTADVALRGEALGQEGDLGRQRIAADYSAQENQARIAAGQQAGETERTGMQIGSQQQLEGVRQAGENQRLGQTLTTHADETAQENASRERIAAGQNDARLAETQMMVEGRQQGIQAKFGQRPFHYDGKEYTLPEGEQAQRAWARERAHDKLSTLERWKGSGPPPDVVEKYARDYIEPQLGLGARTLSPQEAHAQATDELLTEANTRISAGEDRAKVMQEVGGKFEGRVQELLGGQTAPNSEKPQGPPAGEEAGPGEKTEAPQQESLEELETSPLASERARAKTMRDQAAAKAAGADKQVADAEKAWNTTYEADYGPAPKTRAEWVQRVDAARTKPAKPIMRQVGKGIQTTAGENPAEQQLLHLGQLRGWKWPAGNEDWKAIKDELRGAKKE